MEVAFSFGETQCIGRFAGALAAYYDGEGKRREAAALRSRALAALRGVEYSLWLLDQIGATGSSEERERARDMLTRAAADPGHLSAQATLALFEARVAHRARDRGATKRWGRDAAERFGAIGWKWEEAAALEMAGEFAQALAIYRAHGYVRDAQRLAQLRRRARHRPSARELTPREAEIARLAVAGRSNRAIADELHIGERTVETHIAALFDRFDLSSRAQLATLIGDDARPVS